MSGGLVADARRNSRDTDYEIQELKDRAQNAEQKLRDSTMTAILASLQSASIRADVDSKLAHTVALSAASKIEKHEAVCLQRYSAIESKLEAMARVPETLATLVSTIEASQNSRIEQFQTTVARLNAQDSALAKLEKSLNQRAITMLFGVAIALLGLIGYLLDHYVLSQLAD